MLRETMATELTSRLSRTTKRPIIGFQIRDEITNNFDVPIWEALNQSIREQRANLITFMQFPVWYCPDGLEYNLTSYRQINADNLDGMVSFEMGLPWVNEKLQHFSTSPNIVLNFSNKAFPSITVDQAGIRKAIEHLIQVHHKQKFIFISGNKGNVEAETRLAVFKQTLKDHQLPVSPEYIFYGDFSNMHCGEAIIEEAIQKKHLEFDAVVCANDLIAASAITGLEKNGLKVPYDIAVTGFDDEQRAKFSLPSLTTVQASFSDMIRVGSKKLFERLSGQNVPVVTETFPTRLIVRQSCGCLPESILSASISAASKTRKERNSRGVDLSTILSSVMGKYTDQLNKGWQESLLDSFHQSMKTGTPQVFIQELDGLLRQSIQLGIPLDQWQQVISIIRQFLLNPKSFHSAKYRQTAEDILLQGRIFVANTTDNLSRRINLDDQDFNGTLLSSIQSILSTFNMEGFLDALCTSIPQNLPVSAIYLALYEGQAWPADQARLILAYNKKDGRMPIAEEEALFDCKQILPQKYFPTERPFHYVVAPLYFQKENLGYVVFEAERIGSFFGSLQKIIAGALKGVLLFNQRDILVEHVTGTANQIADASEQLDGIIESSTLALRQISQSMDQIAQGANQQAQSVNNTVMAIDQMAGTSQTIASQAEQGSTFAGQVTEDATKGVDLGNAMMEGMHEIRNTVSMAVDKVGQMGQQSMQIQSILGTLEEITSQTNLLALNAAIEAARAGEHGKGFAVVAAEVRKLAEKSNQSTKEIAVLIDTIQKVIDEAVHAMKLSDEQVSSGMDRATQSNTAMQKIRQASEGLFEKVKAISKGAAEIAQESQQIASSVDDFASVTEENTAATEEVNASTNGMGQQMQEMLEKIHALNDTAQDMQSLVNNFREG